MRRTILIPAFCGLLAVATPAAAQYPFPYQPAGGQYGAVQPNTYQQYGQQGFQPRVAPPVSPYLNLLNRGDPGVNYYNFVRPQLQAQTGMGAPPPTLASAYSPEDVLLDPQDPLSRWPRPTGHPTGFNSYQMYYNWFGTIGAPAQRAGAAQRQPMAPIRR
jgi:hypothetical protein